MWVNLKDIFLYFSGSSFKLFLLLKLYICYNFYMLVYIALDEQG